MEMLQVLVDSRADPNTSYLFRLSRTHQDQGKIKAWKKHEESFVPLEQQNHHTEHLQLFNQILFSLPIKLNIDFKYAQISPIYDISKFKQNI